MFSNKIDIIESLDDLERRDIESLARRKLIIEWATIHRVKGERGKTINHVRQELDTRTDKRARWYETVNGRAKIKTLLRTLEVRERVLTVVKGTRMNSLLAALGKAIFDGKDTCPEGMNAKEWRFNLRIAEARVKKRNLSKDQWGFGAIYNGIIPRRRINGRLRQVVCKRCHTPILFGLVLNGEKITRRKVFCCDACKMKSARHHLER